jgi:anti-anti-sigma factor
MNDSLLTVTVASGSPDTVLELAGELDVSSVPRLSAVLGSIDPDARAVILDLSGLTFLDSSGMGLIAKADLAFKELDRTLVLRSPRPHVLRALQIGGLDELVVAIADDAGTPAA